VALFPAIYSAVMLLAYLLLMPLVGRMRVEPALGLSFGCTIAGYLLLVVTPPRSYLLVTLSTMLSALGATVAGPVLESLVANSISDEERASVMSVLFALILAVTSPFGYIGGVLSSVSDRFPFVLALGSSLANLVLVGLLRSVKARRAGAGAAAG
jgi:DHA1 family tetracycline resistance protein-like MFS transporter